MADGNVINLPSLPENANYFVGNNGDMPHQIRFSEESALEEGGEYIDVFDANGDPLVAYKRQEDGTYTNHF